MKRKKPATATPSKPSTPKRRRISPTHDEPEVQETPQKATPSRKGNVSRAAGGSVVLRDAVENYAEGESGNESGSPTPKANGTAVLFTPRNGSRTQPTGSTTKKKADKSAQKKSAKALLEREDEDDWEGEADLARDILDEHDDESDEEDTVTVNVQEPQDGEAQPANPETPSKRRGRPKGSKTKRSPTPEGDLAPEERYFWQTRPGPAQVSSNSLSSLHLLNHEEYFEEIKKYEDHHAPEKAYLMKLHARSFPQWQFELSQDYNICLHGYGSKRTLVNRFAEWLYSKSKPAPQIVVVNGYTPKLNIRSVISTIASAIAGESETLKLVGQPQEMLDTLLLYLSSRSYQQHIVVMVNSIDGVSLRRAATQSILARLATHPSISVVASADTPTHTLLWNSTLKNQFNFVFHDCTTFAPYDAEFSVVDDVNELLGRKGRRIGGKEGIGFVLKSLPENARSLYRVLLAELLAILTDGIEGLDQDDFDFGDGDVVKRKKDSDEEPGVEYRALYQKASEEFICSSDMNFRFLLKEFHDHQMVTSRRDASGTELLGVPLSREDMEGVLEDLVIG